VGAVRIHMDPESLDTSFGGLTASTFQGVATLITSAAHSKWRGRAGTSFQKSLVTLRI